MNLYKVKVAINKWKYIAAKDISDAEKKALKGEHITSYVIAIIELERNFICL